MFNIRLPVPSPHLIAVLSALLVTTGLAWFLTGASSTVRAAGLRSAPAAPAAVSYEPTSTHTWSVETVDEHASGPSLALDAAGYPQISYGKDNELKHARWTGSDWVIETVDSSTAGLGSWSTSLALDSSGNPQIAYYRASGQNWTRGSGLKFAHWTGSAWESETVDPEGSPGSLALDSAGNAHISYCRSLTAPYDDICLQLRYARWTGTGWVIQTLDQSRTVGSLVLDASGKPNIAYTRESGCRDESLCGVRYARWTGTKWVLETVVSDRRGHDYLELDNAGIPHLLNSAFVDNALRLYYAHRERGGWVTEFVDTKGNGGTAFTLDPAGNPHIAYCKNGQSHLCEGGIRYAHRTGRNWIFETVDSPVALDAASLVVDDAGDSHIAYTDSEHHVKYALGVLDCSAAPAKPSLVSPPDGATRDKRRVLLDWYGTDCAKHYEVVVKKDSPDGRVVDGSEDLHVTRFRTERLLRGKTYYWSLRACGDVGCSTWTRYRHFTINE